MPLLRPARLQKRVQAVDEPLVTLVRAPPYGSVSVGSERTAAQLLPHAANACAGHFITASVELRDVLLHHGFWNLRHLLQALRCGGRNPDVLPIPLDPRHQLARSAY